MKKHLEIITALLFFAGILFSCKKVNTPKDYTASIKDKTWWGVMTYTSQVFQYYSVHFNADNTLKWSQLSGDYDGQWIINGKQLTITFSVSGVEIKADISDDDKLMNIADNTTSYIINSGELIANPNLPLDNTVWKGSISDNSGGTSSALQMSFMPGLKIGLKVGNGMYGPYSYTRSPSDAIIRFQAGVGYPYFGVVTSGGEMKGSYYSFNHPWQIIKQ
jgi:hypothetical protein